MRIGYGIGTQGLADGGARFAELIDALEALGFDSIWCSERATGPIPEPMVSLAFAAGRTKKLKLGTSVQVLPGRNPVLLAKQWASLDVLSGGRALPAFGLGVVEPLEQQAFGVTREERAPWFDEALPAHPSAVERGLRRPRRSALPLRGRVDRHPSDPATARRVARRPSAARAATGRRDGRRVAAVVLHARDRRRRAASRSRRLPPRSTARSTTSTTARWCSTAAPRCPSPTRAWSARGWASIPAK